MMNLIDIINANFHYIVEILVVVFGVLIAFFITNVSEERKRRKRISQILEIVKLNFTTDIKNIDIEINIINKKEDNIIKILDPNINNDKLSEDDKLSAFSFLYDHPSINIQKEGFYLLKDADFNYDTKRNKIVSEIITVYSFHIASIERQRDRVIRNSENNTINHMQDPWLYYNQQTKEGRLKTLNYINEIINSESFINEIDYTAQCIFSNYRTALKDYKVRISEILERLKQ